MAQKLLDTVGTTDTLSSGGNKINANFSELYAASVLNTAKVSLTPTQITAIQTNTAKVGITPTQITAIQTNTAKVGITPTQITAIQSSAPSNSPVFTGTPTAPTAVVGTNTTQLATTAFVLANGGGGAGLASPAFTGTPTAPTAVVGTNTTQLATTAFVLANGGGGGNLAIIPASAWLTPALNPGWANAANISYGLFNGVVYVVGGVRIDGTNAGVTALVDSVIFTMPWTGAATHSRINIISTVATNGGVAQVQISTNGDFTYLGTKGATGVVDTLTGYVHFCLSYPGK